MPKPRSSQVSLIDIPYYHPLLPLRITRCKSRLFMWYGSRAIDEYLLRVTSTDEPG
jgi:hypothetical protein